MTNASKEIDIKVVLLGMAMVGKTSLVDRYLHERFLGDTVPYQNTIGAAFGEKKINIHGKTIHLGIWDTAGSERYASLSRIYYRGAVAAIICYDLTEKTSLDRADFWINELQSNETGCKLYLCGTKRDIIDKDPSRRQVERGAAEAIGDNYDAEVFETSSKSGENIQELFLRIAEDYVKDWDRHRSAAVLRGDVDSSDEDSNECYIYWAAVSYNKIIKEESTKSFRLKNFNFEDEKEKSKCCITS